MNQNKTLKLPVNLLVLDAIGSIFLGLGLAEWLAETNLVPISLQFENYAIFMVAIGVIMILPITLFIIRFAMNKQTREL